MSDDTGMPGISLTHEEAEKLRAEYDDKRLVLVPCKLHPVIVAVLAVVARQEKAGEILSLRDVCQEYALGGRFSPTGLTMLAAKSVREAMRLRAEGET